MEPQKIYIPDAKCFMVDLRGLVCAITSDKMCKFSLYLREHSIASSKDGVMYFTEQYIDNPILFGVGKSLDDYDNLKGLDATNLCSWRYDGLSIFCDTPNITLTIHTIPIEMFL